MRERPDGIGSYRVEAHPVGGADDEWQLVTQLTQRQAAYDAAQEANDGHRFDQARVINASGVELALFRSFGPEALAPGVSMADLVAELIRSNPDGLPPGLTAEEAVEQARQAFPDNKKQT